MTESSDSNGAESSNSDDVKRKFREALERKNHKNTTAFDHKDGRSKVAGTHGPADHKRDFRRKSG
jgi:hypothetical protein